MKVAILFLIALLPLRGNELVFEVVFDTTPSEVRDLREYRQRFFLDAYDAFHAAVEKQTAVLPGGAPTYRLHLPSARLLCDTQAKVLRVVFDQDISASDQEAIAKALIFEVKLWGLQKAGDELSIKFAAMKKDIDAEQNPTRRLILEDLLVAAAPGTDGKPTPFPLRLRMKG